jgi:hypothetical protein
MGVIKSIRESHRLVLIVAICDVFHCDEMERDAFVAGAFRLLPKPIHLDELFSIMDAFRQLV